jgi:hypothetical protein
LMATLHIHENFYLAGAKQTTHAAFDNISSFLSG